MELWQKSVSELAKMFKKGEVSSTEIVKAHLKRIDQINPSLNAICMRIDDQALAAAKTADESRANGDVLGPLAGVPFTNVIKVHNETSVFDSITKPAH